MITRDALRRNPMVFNLSSRTTMAHTFSQDVRTENPSPTLFFFGAYRQKTTTSLVHTMESERLHKFHSSDIKIPLLGSLKYLGRGFTFDGLEEATATSSETYRKKHADFNGCIGPTNEIHIEMLML